MGFPDRIERSISVAHPPATVWEAITTAEGLGTWFGHKATVDGPGGQPADHPAGDRQTPRLAHRGRAGHRRAWRAAARPLPAPVGPHPGRAAVSRRVGP